MIYIIFLVILIVLFIYKILSFNKDNKELNSILDYYRWHNALFEPPTSDGKFLIQTDDKNDKIKISFYSHEYETWNLPQNINVIAWCHLPNHLYPNNYTR